MRIGRGCRCAPLVCGEGTNVCMSIDTCLFVTGPTEESAVWIEEPDLIEGKDKVHMHKPKDPLGYDHVLYVFSNLVCHPV